MGIFKQVKEMNASEAEAADKADDGADPSAEQHTVEVAVQTTTQPARPDQVRRDTAVDQVA